MYETLWPCSTFEMEGILVEKLILFVLENVKSREVGTYFKNFKMKFWGKSYFKLEVKQGLNYNMI